MAKQRVLSGSRSLVGQKVLTEPSKQLMREAEKRAERLSAGDKKVPRFAPVRGRDVSFYRTEGKCDKSVDRQLRQKSVSEDSGIITGEE